MTSLVGETKASSSATIPSSSPSSPLAFLDKVLFRSSTNTDPANPDVYQITTTTHPTARQLLTFQIYRFHTNDTDNGTDNGTNDAPLCGGEIQINTLSTTTQAITTTFLTGDLQAIGMEEQACGTLDVAQEQIVWSNQSTWEVHARVVEDSLEALVGLTQTNVVSVTPIQMKLQMLFDEFDQDGNGALDYNEFMALDAATEDDPQPMTEDSFLQIVSIVHSVRDEDPERRHDHLDLIDLTCIYVGPVAEMFQTDLNVDFAAVFPDEAKVALIFDAFDQDQDGFWSPEEEAEYVAQTGRDSSGLEWFRKEDGTTCVSIASLLPMYLTDGAKSDDLDVGFQVAGTFTGFDA